MHKLEGVSSGLPIVYQMDSGDCYLTSKYGYGLRYVSDFESCLKQVVENHETLYNKIKLEFDLFLNVQTDKYLDFILK